MRLTQEQRAARFFRYWVAKEAVLKATGDGLRTPMTALSMSPADEPPVLVDWLPWNHTFGGNHNIGITLYNGGTLYIDEGKPTADMIWPEVQ